MTKKTATRRMMPGNGFVRKMAFVMTLAWGMGTSCNAQAVEFPTIDLYDTDVMNMYTEAYARTFAQRKDTYLTYLNLAVDAYGNTEYARAIRYANSAIETGLDSGVAYYLMGLAYRESGNYDNALKALKIAKKQGIKEAAEAYNNLSRTLKAAKSK